MEGGPRQLFSDQLREWADEGIARIEREARRDFAELVKGAIMDAIRAKKAVTPIPISHDELMDIIDKLVKECEED